MRIGTANKRAKRKLRRDAIWTLSNGARIIFKDLRKSLTTLAFLSDGAATSFLALSEACKDWSMFDD